LSIVFSLKFSTIIIDCYRRRPNERFTSFAALAARKIASTVPAKYPVAATRPVAIGRRTFFADWQKLPAWQFLPAMLAPTWARWPKTGDAPAAASFAALLGS
jgi:hypothetical protein